MAHSNCSKCPFRARYDKNSHSILGRIWRWHIGFCPGWKKHLAGLSDEDRAATKAKYSKKGSETPPL